MIAWSFSSLSDFLNCPRQYQKTRVTKEVVRAETDEMRYGTVTHKSLEDRLILKTPLPDHLANMENFIAKVEQSEGTYHAEQKMCINDKFEPVEWFDKLAWSRSIVDVGVKNGDMVWQGDYKTGKPRAGSDQLMLSAAHRMHIDPEVCTVKTSYIWLRTRKMDNETYHRDQLPEIWKHFLAKVARLEKAYEKDAWPPKPSGLCPWCPLSKSQCEFKR